MYKLYINELSDVFLLHVFKRNRLILNDSIRQRAWRISPSTYPHTLIEKKVNNVMFIQGPDMPDTGMTRIHNLLFILIFYIQFDLSYPAMSGPALIRIRDLAGYGRLNV